MVERLRLAQLRAELDRLSLVVLPRSALGEALGYTLNNWKALVRYTEAPFLAIDSNHSERQIKQLVIGRKNWLFCARETGAENAAILYSLVVSCKRAESIRLPTSATCCCASTPTPPSASLN